jgi:hypothetical protein
VRILGADLVKISEVEPCLVPLQRRVHSATARFEIGVPRMSPDGTFIEGVFAGYQTPKSIGAFRFFESAIFASRQDHCLKGRVEIFWPIRDLDLLGHFQGPLEAVGVGELRPSVACWSYAFL